MKAINTILLTIIIQVTIFAQWEWQNPKPTGNRIYAVHFTDSLNGIAIGKCGDIINTSNGGISWENNNIGSCKTLNDLFFINSDIGFIVGEEGLILKTTDAGHSWANIISGTSESLNSVYFPVQDTGYIVCDNGVFLYSFNGGMNWSNKIIGNDHLNDIYFLNHQLGFACCQGQVFKTTDAGNTWFNQFISQKLFDIIFINDSVGFIAGQDGRLLKTSDQGEIWSTIQFATWADFKSIVFTDNVHGFLTGGNTTLKTTNGGEDWIFVPPPVPATNLETQFFFDESKGLVMGEGGRIFSTTNSGITWIPYFNGIQEHLQKLIFINQTTGYLASDHSVYKSTDGGSTWIKKADVGLNIYDMCFSSDSIGYLIKSGDVYKSTDYGESWDSIYTIEGGGGFTIDFVNDSIGFIAGNNRIILKTTNGGYDWIQVNRQDNFALLSIDMIDSLYGCAVGEISVVYITTDGGNNWILNWLYPPEVQFLSVKFYDRTLGITVGVYGEIYKTMNAGITWQAKNSGVTTSLLDIYFLDKDTIYVIGDGGVILKSTNKGESWNKIQCPTINSLYSLSFVDSSTGLIVGQDGTILTNMSVISGIDHENNQTINSSRFLLNQNYPNPFNPATSLQYAISSRQIVTLKVYDVLGREIATLVNEEKPAGEYEIEFDGSNLPSGIYFYRIKAGDYIETRKMVLLK